MTNSLPTSRWTVQVNNNVSETGYERVSQNNFRLCLRTGNGLMTASLAAFVIAILIAYQFNHLVSMPAEIAAHIGSMILPGFFKIGYVLRCIGRKHLGKEV